MDENEFARIRDARRAYRAAERPDRSAATPTGPTVAPMRDFDAAAARAADDEADRRRRRADRSARNAADGEAEIDRLRRSRADRRAGIDHHRPDIDALRDAHNDRARTPSAERPAPQFEGRAAPTVGFRQSRIERSAREAAAARDARRAEVAERDQQARNVRDVEDAQ